MEKGLIYSRRYPIDLILTGMLKEEETAVDGKMRNSYEWVQTSHRKFWARYQDKSFVLKEERVQPAKEFVQRVKDFCDIHGVAVDIWRGNFCVSAELFLSASPYSHRFTIQFAQLMALCDRMSMWMRRDGAGEFMIQLDFDTHDVYMSGRRMNDIL